MKRMMLDSGAFSGWSRGETIDIDQYIEFIKNNEEYIDCFINLDVLPPKSPSKEELIETAKKSVDNWDYMRSKGLNAIPVFHAGADIKYLDHYLKHTDYIALGAIATTQTEQRFHWLDEVWNKHLTDKKGFPVCKVHAMGLSAVEMMFRYPWYSLDSSAFVKSAAYGKVYLPDYENGKWVYDCNRVKVITVSERNSLSTSKPDNFNKNQVRMKTKAEATERYLMEEHGVTVEQIKDSFQFRACVKGRYFQKLRKTLPIYPWSFFEVTLKRKKERRMLPMIDTAKTMRKAKKIKVPEGHQADIFFVVSSVHSKWIWTIDDINQEEVLSSYYFVRKNTDRFRQFIKGEKDEDYEAFPGYRN